MKVVAIVQARMGSSRLPGKVLKTVLERPLLSWQLDRLRLATTLDHIVIATSVNPADAAIEAFCATAGVDCHRGSELDVLDRYHEAAHRFDADAIVRITAVCPLIDPRTVDELVGLFRRSDLDYASTDLDRTFPLGMDAEVARIGALDAAWQEATAAADREHVMPFLYRQPERFRLGNLRCATASAAHLRWTVDTPDDLEVVTHLLEAVAPLHPSFTLDDLLSVTSKHPEWTRINAGIRQKILGE